MSHPSKNMWFSINKSVGYKNVSLEDYFILSNGKAISCQDIKNMYIEHTE